MNLYITNGIASSMIFYFNFETVNFLFLDGDVPRSPPYDVYISQLIRFARVSSSLNNLNKVIVIIKFEKHFLNSTTYAQS